MGAVDLENTDPRKIKALTCTEVLQELGIDRPTNTQARECGGVLRELFGNSVRINGREKWRVPLREPDRRGARADSDRDKFD